MLLRAMTEDNNADNRRANVIKAFSLGLDLEMLDPFVGPIVADLKDKATTHLGSFVPHLKDLEESYPLLNELPEPTGDVEELVYRIRSKFIAAKVDSLFQKWTATRKKGAIDAMLKLHAELEQLSQEQVGGGITDFDENFVDWFLEDLQDRGSNDGCVGLPYPWEVLNMHLGGMNPGDMIALWALPKNMKSWLGLYMACFALQAGKRVLVFSQDMNDKRTLARVACMVAGIDYTDYRHGRLSEDEVEEVRSFLYEAVSLDGKLRFTTGRRLDGKQGGIEEIERQARQFMPDLVLLDSAYTLGYQGSGDARWERMANLSSNIKATAERLAIPFIAIFQENESKAWKYKGKTSGTASIADASHIIRDVDVGIRVVYAEWAEQISLHLAAARETKYPGLTIWAKPGISFDYVGDELHEFGNAPPENKEQSNTSDKGQEHLDQYSGGSAFSEDLPI